MENEQFNLLSVLKVSLFILFILFFISSKPFEDLTTTTETFEDTASFQYDEDYDEVYNEDYDEDLFYDDNDGESLVSKYEQWQKNNPKLELIDINYNHSMFYGTLSSKYEYLKKNNLKAVLHCFGLGPKFSKLLDGFLKKDSNGTGALNVTFYAISRNQPDRASMQHGELFSLENIDFNMKRRTIFIVHGFLTDSKQPWIKDMERAFLKWDDVNIFVVDWNYGANTWNYFKAAINTRTVGDQIATFIGKLVEYVIDSHGPDSSDWGPLHLIGHSLGAHICGYASHQLQQRGQTKWPVQRITGLDPAQPCFRYSDPSLRLDRSDAQFVDVIHTNGRLLNMLGLGVPYPLGHIDFYPNGGSFQPGCILAKSSIWKFIPLPFEKIKNTICSHGRSQLYFTESIITAAVQNCTFWARQWNMSYIGTDEILSRKCDFEDNVQQACAEMGINAEKYRNGGTYITITGGSAPYCKVDKSGIEEIKKFMEKLKRRFKPVV